MTDAPAVTITHAMIRVSDLERSAAFYREVLEFRPTRRTRVDNAEDIVGAPHEWVDVQFLEHPAGPTIELVHAPATPAERAPHDTVLGFAGLNHLACQVDDVDRVIAVALAHGGRVIDSSRSIRPNGRQVVFICDPDGTRLELVGPVR